jgi:hypothetical protein
MTKNNEANLLVAELDKESEENKKFLADIDAKIRKTDLEYTKVVIEEEKGLLKLAKNILNNTNN